MATLDHTSLRVPWIVGRVWFAADWVGVPGTMLRYIGAPGETSAVQHDFLKEAIVPPSWRPLFTASPDEAGTYDA